MLFKAAFYFQKLFQCITEKLKGLKDDNEQSEIKKAQSSDEETQAVVEDQSKTARIQEGGNGLATILSMVTSLQKSTNTMLADREKTNTALAVLHSTLTALEQKEQFSIGNRKIERLLTLQVRTEILASVCVDLTNLSNHYTDKLVL